MTRKRPGPGCAVWELTLRCNLHCMHCGSSAGKARSDELTTDEALDLCHQLNEIGCGGVALMGGEPLLREDWHIIAKEVKKLGMDLSIITNGYNISSRTFNLIERIRPELVAISIDGASSQTHDSIRGKKGSFTSAMQSLDRFIKMGLPVGIITTVHKMNLKELKGIRTLLLNKGVSWQIQMATPFGRLSKDMVLSKEEFYSVAMFIAATQSNFGNKQILIAGAHDMGYFSECIPPVQVTPWRGCSAGISTLGIQSDGKIRGCLSLPATFNEGDIRETRLAHIWNAPDIFRIARHVRKEDIGGDCVSCTYNHICKGGCSAVSYSLSGKFHQDPYCLRMIEGSFQ